jgi:hypothetical protein
VAAHAPARLPDARHRPDHRLLGRAPEEVVGRFPAPEQGLEGLQVRVLRPPAARLDDGQGGVQGPHPKAHRAGHERDRDGAAEGPVRRRRVHEGHRRDLRRREVAALPLRHHRPALPGREGPVPRRVPEGPVQQAPGRRVRGLLCPLRGALREEGAGPQGAANGLRHGRAEAADPRLHRALRPVAGAGDEEARRLRGGEPRRPHRGKRAGDHQQVRVGPRRERRGREFRSRSRNHGCP